MKIIEMDYNNKEHHLFLKEMMYQAIYVPDDEPRPDKSIVNDPLLQKYYMNFGKKSDDMCYFAYDNDKLSGAVWLRKFSKESAGYGFVSEDIPEMSIAVDYSYRGKGIGTKLLKHLFRNIPVHIIEVSLSVDTNNRAYDIYKNSGFKNVSIESDTAIMKVKVTDFLNN